MLLSTRLGQLHAALRARLHLGAAAERLVPEREHFCVVALTRTALGVRPGSVDVVATLAGSGVGLAHDAASTHGTTTIGDACMMDVTSRGRRYLLTPIRTVERNQPCGRM